MTLPRFASALALAGAGLFVAASAASAYPATATTTLNVRSGPGTQYAIVGVLQRGQTVEVFECTDAGGWCQVQDPTLSGWASARYLARIDEADPLPDSPPPPESDVNFSIETPDFSFQVGSGNRPGYRPPSVGQVCFYDEDDYRGREFCAGSGDEDRYLVPAWDDLIRSIAVEGDLEVTVCTGVDLSGQCSVLTQSARNLGDLTDAISSYRVNRF